VSATSPDAGTSASPSELDPTHEIHVDRGHQVDLPIAGRMKRLDVGDANIADVRKVDSCEIIILGVMDGETTLNVWLAGGKKDSYRILVAKRDIAPLPALIRPMLEGIADVSLRVVGDAMYLEGCGRTREDGQVVRALLAQFPLVQTATLDCDLRVLSRSDDHIRIEERETQRLSVPDVARFSIGDGALATVTLLKGEATVLGKAPGSTSLHVWSAHGKKTSLVLDVVRQDASVLVPRLKLLTAGMDEFSFEVHDGRVYVAGTPSSGEHRTRLVAILDQFPAVMRLAERSN
jgi:Flp pilus assembly secretin CpaC